MADSDKELHAMQALRRIECKHTSMLKHTKDCLLAGVVESVMNNRVADFASKL